MNSDLLKHLTENERAAISTLVARLRRKYAKRLVRVVLFGSKARGETQTESDIDLLLVFKSNGADLKRRVSKEELEIELAHGVAFGGLKVARRNFENSRKSARRSIAVSATRESVCIHAWGDIHAAPWKSMEGKKTWIRIRRSKFSTSSKSAKRH